MSAAMDGTPSHVAVLGGGTMGRGIAYAAAVSGSQVALLDLDHETLTGALARINRDLDDAVARGRLDSDAARRAHDRIEITTDIAVVARDADLIIESIVERVDAKHRVLLAAQQAAPGHAVIASNTSALSITELIACLPAPSRGVGMHFFNPVPKMKLCEVIRGLQTSEETIRVATAAARALGKQTIVVNDVPGFATSRLNAALGNEAMRMVEEGVASAPDIDTGARLALNHPMGPLEMVDLVGLDVRLAVLEHLERRLGERFRPTNIHRRLLAAGRLGRKTGHGFYRYDHNGKKIDTD